MAGLVNDDPLHSVSEGRREGRKNGKKKEGREGGTFKKFKLGAFSDSYFLLLKKGKFSS